MSPEQNKAIVLEAFDTLFNRRDFEGARRFWAKDYIQHNPLIPDGREALFDYVGSLPGSTRFEYQLSVAEGDLVMTSDAMRASKKISIGAGLRQCGFAVI